MGQTVSASGPAYDSHSAGQPWGVPPGGIRALEAGRGREEREGMMEGAPEHPCPTHPPAPGLRAHLRHWKSYPKDPKSDHGYADGEGVPAVPTDSRPLKQDGLGHECGPPTRRRSSRCFWPFGSLESKAHPPQPNLPAVVHAPIRASEITPYL